VNLHGAVGNGQANAGSAGLPIPVGVDAVERFEYSRQGFIGNAGAEVSNADEYLAVVAAGCDLNLGVFRRVADGIPNDVLHGAAKQFLVAVNDERKREVEADPAFSQGSLDGTCSARR